ncbi:PLP-dependent transferase [Teratosphaeria nubilosa]|uniref:PLP-dependent transferase n=1 Tax=Teratosphaeria nubilosa TaxID=161662 RepID=A0A6G1L5J8_9PEZI|nr:PLP-dependent transferase [Teratosphaeria nubilosa]
MAQPNGHTGNPNTTSFHLPSSTQQHPSYSLATLGVHADDPINSYTDVAPALHVATTFRYSSNPDALIPEEEIDFPSSRAPDGAATSDSHIYSRLTAPNTSRLELILSSILGGPVLVYGSGLSASHALLVYLNPKVVAIGNGYHGCHGVLKLYQKLTKCKIVDLFDEESWDAAGLGEGDVVHLETPVNPTGRAFNIQAFSEKAKKRGAVLTVDATFAPPPLLDPFRWGADFVMHSGTKYIGGHSDMLCGVISISKARAHYEKDYWSMFSERVYLGSVMGSLEGWLGVRSLRTYELRVKRQSENADRLVSFLASALAGQGPKHAVQAVQAVLAKIEHASLQEEDMGWLRQQMPNGFGPVFSIWCKNSEQARRLPSKLHLFHHATSLGGTESLIEWRRMSDGTVERELLRVSVGVEAWEDLRDDLVGGFRGLVAEGR